MKYGRVGCLASFREKKRVQFLTAIDRSSGSGGGAAGTAPPGSGRSLNLPKRQAGQAVRPHVADWIDESDPVQG